VGRAPFVGDSVADILAQVRDRLPERPSKLNPSVPRDLEVICLKCMEKDAARRYGSARALAEDLECFRDGRPITARPVGLAERTWMLARRNGIAAGLTAAMAVAVLALGFAAVGYLENARLVREMAVVTGRASRAAPPSEPTERPPSPQGRPRSQDEAPPTPVALSDARSRIDRPGEEKRPDAEEPEPADEPVPPPKADVVSSAPALATKPDVTGDDSTPLDVSPPKSDAASRPAIPRFRRRSQESRLILTASEIGGDPIFSLDGSVLVTPGHPESSLLTTDDQRSTWIWDLKTGGRQFAVDGGFAAAINPEGNILAIGGHDGVRFYNLGNGWPAGEIPIKDGEMVQALAFSASGRTLATGSAV
jgi:hypothetical protein